MFGEDSVGKDGIACSAGQTSAGGSSETPPVNRREFVRRAGMIAASGVFPHLVACREVLPPPDEGEGTVTVTITGFKQSATSAGSINVNIPGVPDISLPSPVGGTSSGSANVPVGSAQVTYSPPSDHTLASGESASKTVTVLEGATTNVSWAVAPVTGTLRGTISGLGTGSSAGTLSAQPPVGPAIPIALPVPSGGSSVGSQVVPTDTYQVTYSPPPGYSLAPGHVGTRQAVVTAGQTVDVAWQVQASVSGAYDWENQWETAGQSNAAVLGTGFTTVAGSGTSQLNVIDKPGHWPTAARGKVLQVVYPAADGNGRWVEVFPWSPFSAWNVGEYRHLFFFFERVDAPDDAESVSFNNGAHGHEATSGPGGPNPWSMGYNNHNNLRLTRRFKELGNGGATRAFDSNASKPLTRNTVYQIEFVIRFMGGSTIRAYCRVWNADGTSLLLDTPDFIDRFNATAMLDYSLDLGSNSAGLIGFTVGENGGGSGKDNWTDRWADMRAWTKTSLSWIGPVT